MFIRKTRTSTSRGGTHYTTHRLVETWREGPAVRQRTLMNLGRHFRIEQRYWKLLCVRVGELTGAQESLCAGPLAPEVEAEARRIARSLLERQGESLPEEPHRRDCRRVDLDSARDHTPRTVGVEHAALAALDLLGLPALLEELGFSRRQRLCAIGNIVGRMVRPGSERRTHAWLRSTSALGEMLGIDFGTIGDMALYRASDRLLRHRSGIEGHLFRQAMSLFSLQPTVAFYDLTNTYFEGRAAGNGLARHGRSKEKRSDCPLMTLAAVIDASGFVMKSRVFAGNVAERATLEQMLCELGFGRDAVVVMDRGMADEGSLAWLREQGWRYVVVSRGQRREFECEGEAESNGKVSYCRRLVELAEDDGTPYREAHLWCHSPDRERKETGILDRFRKRFEEGLNAINAQLAKPRASRRPDVIERRIGRLQKANSRIARHFRVEVDTDADGRRVEGVRWYYEPVEGTMATHPGVYCLRSSILDWDAERMWQTYMTLTEVESVFRCLKSELGLRPVYHQKAERAEGHLFISVLAYQAVCVLRTRLKAGGCHDSWQAIRDTLGTLVRTTTAFERDDRRTLHLRKTAEPEPEMAALYEAMGIPAPPRKLRKTII